jgi:hypothetical protein
MAMLSIRVWGSRSNLWRHHFESTRIVRWAASTSWCAPLYVIRVKLLPDQTLNHVAIHYFPKLHYAPCSPEGLTQALAVDAASTQ